MKRDDPYEADESELAEEASPDAYDLEALQKQGDVPGILGLAKAYRSGTAPGGRDMKMCLSAYRAAAELGSAEAEYAVALFYLNGGSVVAQDLKEGTTRLRSAAEKGSIPAKIYLGNLYELGINYKADAEKADVWYRNAGRAAQVEGEQGSDEWNRALAELGGARHVLALTQSAKAKLSEDDKARLLARAKAHGYGLKIREESGDSDRATFVDALTSADAAPLTGTPPPVAMDLEPRQRKDTAPETKQAKQRVEAQRAKAEAAAAPTDKTEKEKADNASAADKKHAAERRARVSAALGAFGYALLFAVAGIGAGYAATLGARELVAHGHVLPLVKTETRLVFPIVLGVIGVLPSALVYKFGTVLKAIVLGAMLGGVGWVAWGTGQGAFHGDRLLQALAFGIAGFLAGLLVLGLLGGAKQRQPLPRRS
jgi:hypothetical protein